MTQEHPEQTMKRCTTCNQKVEPTTDGRYWKLKCDCGEIPIKFAKKIPEGWT